MSKLKNVEDIYELSPLQQALQKQILAGPAPAVVQSIYTIQALDTMVLRQAWQWVMQRYPVLRTSFQWEGLSKPVQVVHSQLAVPLQELDWRTVPRRQRPARLKAFLEQDLARPFTLTEAPLLRLTLIRLTDRAYRYIWSYPPILFDEPSAALIFHDLFGFYQGRRQGRPFTPPPAPPYRGYVAWLQQQNRAQAESFWRESLAGFTSPTPLATEVGEKAEEAPVKRRRQRVPLPPGLMAMLETSARQSGVTVTTLMHGAWALLLARQSGRQDVVFGIVVDGRPSSLPAAESIAGVFRTTAPLRVTLQPDAPLTTWLARLQTRMAEVQRFGYLPPEEIKRQSQVPAGGVLFESLVSLEADRPERISSQRPMGLKVEPLGRTRPNPPEPLVLEHGPDGHGLRLLYSTDRVSPATARSMALRLRKLLAAIAARPDQTLGMLLRGGAPRKQPRGEDKGWDALLGVCLSALDQLVGDQPPAPPAGAAAPFFCIHPAGQTVRCYGPLARQLGADRPLRGLQPPVAEAGPSKIEAMAAACIASMRAIQPNGPYYLGGWSSGGVVAFAMAQQLVREGQPIGLLALLDVEPPRKKSSGRLRKLTTKLAQQLGLGLSLELFAQLGPDEQAACALEQGRKKDLIGAGVSLDDLLRRTRLFRRYLEAMHDHEPQPYPGKITLFRAGEKSGREKPADQTAWRKLAAEVEVHDVPGSHLTMLRVPHVRTLAEQLRACLGGGE